MSDNLQSCEPSDARAIRGVRRFLADRRFLELKESIERSSLLSVLGQTFTERWHSAFLAWLLNPDGSHGLGDHALRQLLVWIHSPDDEGAPRGRGTQPFGAPRPGPGDIERCHLDVLAIRPNARSRAATRELRLHLPERAGTSEAARSRAFIDVFAVAEARIDDDEPRVWIQALLIEVKVKASEGDKQTRDYAQWTLSGEDAFIDARANTLRKEVGLSDDIVERASKTEDPELRAALLFVAPTGVVPKSREFATLDFQALADEILAPCLDHPHLTVEGRTLIEAYLHNLATPFAEATADRLAVSPFESARVEGLLEDHAEALASISGSLQQQDTSSGSGPVRVSLTDLVRAGRVAENAELEYRRSDVCRRVNIARVAGTDRFGIQVGADVIQAPSTAARRIYGRTCRGWNRFFLVGQDDDTSLLSLRESVTPEEAARVSRPVGSSVVEFVDGVFQAHEQTLRLISAVLDGQLEGFWLPPESDRQRSANLDWLELVSRASAPSASLVTLAFSDDPSIQVVLDTSAPAHRAFSLDDLEGVSGNRVSLEAWTRTWPERAQRSPNRQFRWVNWWRLTQGPRKGLLVRELQ